jgi:DNA adenine methylase
MGSKQKLLNNLWGVCSEFDFDTAIDLFSGSGVVGYMFKAQGKKVISNDYMAMSWTYSNALIQNNKTLLAPDAVDYLISNKVKTDRFVSSTFKGLYFTDADNQLIDRVRTNIQDLDNSIEKSMALASLIRACTKKRARGIFTYVGFKYDDGRKDLSTTLAGHIQDAAELMNSAVFSNGKKNVSYLGSALDIKPRDYSLVYMDPPYYSQHSDNEYVRRYHFVEGLARNWEGLEIQEHTVTKKFKSYPTPFSTRQGAYDAFDSLFRKFADSILVVSYSSNSLPTSQEMVSLMKRYKKNVEVIPVDYRYSFGNQGHKVGINKNSVQEYFFVGW